MITSSNGLIWHYPDIHFYAHWKVLIPQTCGQYSLHRHTLNILYLWLYTNIVDLAIWRVTLKNIFYPKISTKQIVNKEVALLMNIVKIVTCRALFLKKAFFYVKQTFDVQNWIICLHCIAYMCNFDSYVVSTKMHPSYSLIWLSILTYDIYSLNIDSMQESRQQNEK